MKKLKDLIDIETIEVPELMKMKGGFVSDLVAERGCDTIACKENACTGRSCVNNTCTTEACTSNMD